MGHTIRFLISPSGIHNAPIVQIDDRIRPLDPPKDPNIQVFGWTSETDPREIRTQIHGAFSRVVCLDRLSAPD